MVKFREIMIGCSLGLALSIWVPRNAFSQESVKVLPPKQAARGVASALQQEHLPGQGPDVGAAVIYRDRWGVPHIYAPTVEAAMYAKGWAQAEDRPEQLLKNYLMGMGELSSVDGKAALRSDIVSRMFEHYAQAKSRADATVKPELLGHLDAFVAGVRDYFQSHPESLPEWWGDRQFDRYMLIAFSRIFLYNWSVDDGFGELMAAGVRPAFERTSRGSNQFAISPARSAEGAAILYIDPHLAWFGPSRFWEFRVHADKWHGSGFTLAGLPYIGLGHNAKVAWAMTTGGPDTADIYELTLNPENPNQYQYEGQWRELTQRVEKIPVRDGQPEEVTIYSSHHGPIVAWKENKAYAHRMAYFECVNGLEAWWHFNFAEDYRGVLTGLEGNEVFPQNVMVADTSGNIYYHRTGRVPKRPEGYDWTRPVPGDSSATEWTGVHPQSDLVHLLNPSAGYMQNCNITPDAMLVDSPLQPDRYPSYIYGSRGKQMNERGARAVELLSTNHRVTAEQAIDMALDVVPFGNQRWLNELKQADEAHGKLVADHPGYQHALEKLLAWDGRVEHDSQGGLVYYYWRQQIDSDRDHGKQLPGVIDQHFRIAQSDQTFSDPELNETQQRLLVTSLAAAADKIIKEWGKLDATWGDKFRVGRDGKSWPLGGGGDFGTRTLRNISHGPEREDHTRWGNAGQTSTQIVVLSQPIRSWTQPPIGQSDDPDSPHYADQAAQLLSQRRMKDTWWMPKDLAPNIISRTVLDIPQPQIQATE